jgi:uncharacterized membrane protein
MSTNPYAAPRAQVADEVNPRGDFLPSGRTVPTGNGWTWVSDAWAIFRAAAGIWIGMVLLLAVIFIVLAVIPFIGALASFILGPIFTAGLVVASRTVDDGGELQFKELFAGFGERLGTLAGVGGLYLAGMAAIMIVASIVMGVGMFGLLGATPDQVVGLGLALVVGVLLMFGLMLPLVMAIWFAPPLVVFHEMGAVEAMKASFVGCLKNMMPFLLYGIVLLIASLLASIPLFLGWLVLGPVIAASIYTSYRDIYFSRPR